MFADKESIRRAGAEGRRGQPDKKAISGIITDRLMAMPEYRQATKVLWYIGVRDEVATLQAIPAALRQGKVIGVPYCVGDRLELFQLDDLDQLSRGAYGILEPRMELRPLADHRLSPAELELIVIPGVAFDQYGGRLGHGQGYYDRLLSLVPPTACRIALAFESQMMPRVPMEAHDVRMDYVVTQTRTIRCEPLPGVHFEPEA